MLFRCHPSLRVWPPCVYVHVQLTELPTHMHAAQRVQQAAANIQANNTRQHLSARQRRLELMTKANDG